MKWKKYTINTTTQAEDIISAMLDELGVEGVLIEDNQPLSEEDTKGMFIDVLPELPPDDGRSRISFFLREAGASDGELSAAIKGAEDKKCQKISHAGDEQIGVSDTADNSYTIADRIWERAEIDELLDNVRRELSELRSYMDIGEGSIEESETEDADWMNKWKEYFKPFLVEDVLIKPEWEEVPAEYRNRIAEGELRLININPGTAFGTGTHETTKLCIAELSRYVTGAERVLDLGTGTGILGIAALKMGAGKVMATDVDDNCREAVEENLRLNDIYEGDFRLVIGNVLEDEELKEELGMEAYDIVIANILAPVIISLARPGAADRFLKPGGLFITSGIIDEKEDEVIQAFMANKCFELIEVNRMGEWVNITAMKR